MIVFTVQDIIGMGVILLAAGVVGYIYITSWWSKRKRK